MQDIAIIGSDTPALVGHVYGLFQPGNLSAADASPSALGWVRMQGTWGGVGR